MDRLRPEEIFVLLAACYLHDIGMQLDVPDAREEHAEWSHQLILHSRDGAGRQLHVRLSLADRNARQCVALVARAHWTRYVPDLPREEHLHGNVRGRLRLLGALLAMADLLDISPVRTRYFRTDHRLYALNPVSELHHVLHEQVKGFVIEPAKPEVPTDLRFVLRWQDRSDEVRLMADWTLHWFSSQWRQLEPILKAESGGTIRWAEPWAKAVCHAPLGPSRQLSPAARAVLEAERAEQRRIDRDDLAAAFRSALDDKRTALFVLPSDAEGDGGRLGEWCLGQARCREGVRSAHVALRPDTAPEMASVCADILQAWGEELPWDAADPKEALDRVLRTSLAEASCVTVVLTSDPRSRLVDALLDALLDRPQESSENGARICILLSPEAEMSHIPEGSEIHRPDWQTLTRDDLDQHLRDRWGCPPELRAELAEKAVEYGLVEKPNVLYNFMQRECKCWACEDA